MQVNDGLNQPGPVLIALSVPAPFSALVQMLASFPWWASSGNYVGRKQALPKIMNSFFVGLALWTGLQWD